jgi:predicted RNase H-like nuclease (RuvC/YqgF family)
MLSYYKYSKTLVKIFLGLALLGVAVLLWKGDSEDRGDTLSEQAYNINEQSDVIKARADRQAYLTASLKKQIQAKDEEVEYLKAQVVSIENLLELTKQQDESIALRDETIKSLTVENNELRSALKLKEEAFRVQQDASEAYREAIYESKLKSAGLGFGLGIALGVAIIKR